MLFILGLLLSFVTMGQDNSITNDNGRIELSGGTSSARVISPKAVVYADENMLSPLGYIANGKAIVVGNPRRMNKDLVPLVVYGRLAFIEIRDIRYEDNAQDEEYNIKRGAPREHDVDVTIEQPAEVLSENNSMYFTLHRYSAGEEIKQVFANVQNAQQDTMSGFAFQFIHRPEMKKFFWGAAVDYSSISTTEMKFGYWLFSPTMGFAAIRNPLFYLDVYASFDIGINAQYIIENNFVKEPSAYVWGAQANARIVLFPESKYHLVGGLGLRKYSISGLNNLVNLNNAPIPGIKSITSLSMFLGVGMEFR